MTPRERFEYFCNRESRRNKSKEAQAASEPAQPHNITRTTHNPYTAHTHTSQTSTKDQQPQPATTILEIPHPRTASTLNQIIQIRPGTISATNTQIKHGRSRSTTKCFPYYEHIGNISSPTPIRINHTT